MDPTTNKRLKSMTIAEMLPGLSSILSKDGMQSLTAKKQPRQTMVNTSTAVKVIKPVTIAEMRADLLSLRVQSPRPARGATATKKKNWNSSVKVDKTVSHTANGKMRHNRVRKVLNFQPRPKLAPPNESPKFTRPTFKPKKSQARTDPVISGLNNISETPVVTQLKPLKNHTGIKFPPESPLLMKKKLIPIVPDTPTFNQSWSSCDASFLIKEKEILDAEEKCKSTANGPTLANIPAVTQAMSTPFKEYRNVEEYFDHSTVLDNSAVYQDNTIMTFDKPAHSKENTKTEESVIVSLCDLLNKASVANLGKMNTELDELLQIEKQTEHSLMMIDNSISTLNKFKQSQLTSLQYLRKIINEKKHSESQGKTLADTKDAPKVLKTDKFCSERKTVVNKTSSVIKSCPKSPRYKIPNRNLGFRKQVVFANSVKL